MTATTLVRATLVVALLAPGAAVHGQGTAVTLAELTALREGGVSPQQIVRIAQQYCLAFAMEDSAVRVLEGAGGDPTLLDGLRRACVKLPLVLAPGVLLDDDFRVPTRFVADDSLCTLESGAAGLHLVNRRPDRGCAIPYPTDPHPAAVRIELTVVGMNAAGPGAVVLGFGKNPVTWDQHTVAVTTAGEVEVAESAAGRVRRLRPLTRIAGFRRGGPHVIAVELRGAAVDVFVDGRLLASYEAARPLPAGLSLGVGPASQARLERLLVRRAATVASAP